MYRHITIVLLACLVLLGQDTTVQPDESDKEGVLEMLFVMSDGEPALCQCSITVENFVDGKQVSALKGVRTMRLKYGTYRLKTRCPGVYPVEKIVKIQNPVQAVIICLFVSPIEGSSDHNLVRSRISEKSRHEDCRWVRFMSPFADNQVAETKATQNGYFALENLRAGEYLAFTIGKKGICEMADVTIPFELVHRTYDLVIPWASYRRWDAGTQSREEGRSK